MSEGSRVKTEEIGKEKEHDCTEYLLYGGFGWRPTQPVPVVVFFCFFIANNLVYRVHSMFLLLKLYFTF